MREPHDLQKNSGWNIIYFGLKRRDVKYNDILFSLFLAKKYHCVGGRGKEKGEDCSPPTFKTVVLSLCKRETANYGKSENNQWY